MAKEELSKKAKSGKYGADEISVLEGLEPVRRRPGMYIGGTGLEGLHYLIWEIFDNSRDEAMGGYCNHIEVVLLPNNTIRIADNGRGIPVDVHSKTKVSALETVMTVLHAGGKFGGDDSGYKVSGGLHGVGASVVNALSIYTRAEVHRDGGRHIQEYSQGKVKAQVKKIGKSDEHGTIITFQADPEIFKEIKYDWNLITHKLEQQAYLVNNLRIHIIDARNYEGKIDDTDTYWVEDFGLQVPSSTYYFEGGISSLVRQYTKLHKKITSPTFYTSKELDGVGIEIAFDYIDDISTKIVPFANNINTPEGGTHVVGFKTALTRVINAYAKKNNLVKEAEGGFTGDDVLEGLVAVISVKLREIQFEGQTKTKLGSTEAQGAVAKVFGDALSTFFEENPDNAKAIINKAMVALRARKAAKAAKDSILRKSALEGMTLPGKLADCQSKSAEESELFIVEGDSAGGTAKAGRDRKTQAILPLRGKILNVERARLDKLLQSEQVKNLVIALGTSIGETFDADKIRYHKIIIATDADVDGAHIRTLILTLFYRYFPQIIDAGYVYIAQPPLYKIKRGKEVHYAYSDEEKLSIVGTGELVDENDGGDDVGENEDEANDEEATKVATKKVAKWHIQRYKGLGEMNADELKETTMDKDKRVLKQVSIHDAEEANRVFDMLMGSDVAPRKSFIQSYAKEANIDV